MIPLHVACADGNSGMVELLIDRGAFLNAETKLKSTPLHFAVLKDDFNISKILIDANAKLNVQDRYNNTPLHYAAENGYVEILWYLLKHNADQELKNNNNQTAYERAKDVAILQVFKQFGLSASVIDELSMRKSQKSIVENVCKNVKMARKQ